MSAPSRRLSESIRVRSEIVHPRDMPRGEGIFVGLEHIESHTGRRLGQVAIRLEDLTGRKAKFYAGDIVYGYLRPYLNKVWVADFAGYCSVDQYVFQVDRERASPEYIAHYLRSPAYLAAAPIDMTPGQLPRIRTEEVLAVHIPLPPLSDQIRIAAELDSQLDQAARAKDATLETLRAVDALRAALLTKAFEREREREQPR
jgi:type I restriction enzyme, S subunit